MKEIRFLIPAGFGAPQLPRPTPVAARAGAVNIMALSLVEDDMCSHFCGAVAGIAILLSTLETIVVTTVVLLGFS